MVPAQSTRDAALHTDLKVSQWWAVRGAAWVQNGAGAWEGAATGSVCSAAYRPVWVETKKKIEGSQHEL